MITKEMETGQSVALIELEDGRFIEIRQEEDCLVITIPSFAKRRGLRHFMATLVVYGTVDVFRTTILRFTNKHLYIERYLARFRFRQRIPLKRVGEACCEAVDDLYMDWPEDVVMLPLGKNNCFCIWHIKTWEDQKYVANVINSFLTQRHDEKCSGDRPFRTIA